MGSCGSAAQELPEPKQRQIKEALVPPKKHQMTAAGMDAEFKQMLLAQVDAAFAQLDVDGNGSVSSAEIQQVMLGNEDFDFPPEIVAEGGSRAAMIERYFKMMDQNVDGKVTLQEMKDCFERFIDEQYNAMFE